jgi:hypothetical protein
MYMVRCSTTCFSLGIYIVFNTVKDYHKRVGKDMEGGVRDPVLGGIRKTCYTSDLQVEWRSFESGTSRIKLTLLSVDLKY